jgi:hypothetical protein
MVVNILKSKSSPCLGFKSCNIFINHFSSEIVTLFIETEVIGEFEKIKII